MTREWLSTAICVGADPIPFDREERSAAEMCQGCPARQSCLDEAMLPIEQGGTHGAGIRGGLTSEQRAMLRLKGTIPLASWERQSKPSRVGSPNGELGVDEIAKRMTLYGRGLTDPQMGELCGVSRHAIYLWRKRLGLPANQAAAPRLTFDDRRKRVELHLAGATVAQMAKTLGVSQDAIRTWRKRYVDQNRKAS